MTKQPQLAPLRLPIARRLLLFVLLLSLAACEKKNDPRKALSDAQSLTSQGDYPGALAKHVWFHDHALKLDPGLYGVRLSYALSDWIELGKKYPPALVKLRSIRDEKMARLAAGEADRALFHDVAAINEGLGEMVTTVELFKRIGTNNPGFASEVYRIADVALLQAHEYSLARKYLGDPTARLAIAAKSLKTGMQFGENCRPAFERIYADEAVRIITILRKTDDVAGAKEIQQKALATSESAAIRNALP